jgi:hypothetical protein
MTVTDITHTNTNWPMDDLLAEITTLEIAAAEAKHAAKGHTDIQRSHERRVEELLGFDGDGRAVTRGLEP